MCNSQHGNHFPRYVYRGENKKDLSCHHLVGLFSFALFLECGLGCLLRFFLQHDMEIMGHDVPMFQYVACECWSGSIAETSWNIHGRVLSNATGCHGEMSHSHTPYTWPPVHSDLDLDFDICIYQLRKICAHFRQSSWRGFPKMGVSKNRGVPPKSSMD